MSMSVSFLLVDESVMANSSWVVYCVSMSVSFLLVDESVMANSCWVVYCVSMSVSFLLVDESAMFSGFKCVSDCLETYIAVSYCQLVDEVVIAWSGAAHVVIGLKLNELTGIFVRQQVHNKFQRDRSTFGRMAAEKMRFQPITESGRQP